MGHVRLQKYRHKATVKKTAAQENKSHPNKQPSCPEKSAPNIAHILWCTRNPEKWRKSSNKQTLKV